MTPEGTSVEDLRQLEAELATRKGFAARVQPPDGLRNFGGTIAVIGLLPGLGVLVPGHRVDALAGLGICLVVGLLVSLVGLVRERLAIGPLHERYLARGWVSVQAPTGLVRDSSGEGTFVRRDRGLASGKPDGTDPVVLVGGRPGTPPQTVEAAAAAARDALVAMTDDESRSLSRRVEAEGLYRDTDPALFFPVPGGLFLTVQAGSSPYVLVVPAANASAGGSGGPGADRPRREWPRYYGIRTPGTSRTSDHGSARS